MSQQDYIAAAADVLAALKEDGAAVVLKRSVGGDYDPATCKTSPATVMEFPSYALIEDYKTGAIDGTLVMVGDKKLTLSADIPEPATADTITVGTTIYKVVSCKTLAPAGIAILYEVQARK